MKFRYVSCFLLIAVFIISSSGFGQQRSQAKPFDMSSVLRSLTTSGAGQYSLFGFNPDNLQMRHSYEMSFFSFGGQSLTQAIYMNTIKYKISDPVSLTFQWGVHHQPFNGMIKNNISTQGAFISGAELKYQPSDKVMFKIQYNSYPYGVNPYYNPSYYNRFGYYDPFGSRSIWDDDE